MKSDAFSVGIRYIEAMKRCVLLLRGETQRRITVFSSYTGVDTKESGDQQEWSGEYAITAKDEAYDEVQ